MVKKIAFIYTDTTGLHKKMEYGGVDAKNLHTIWKTVCDD